MLKHILLYLNIILADWDHCQECWSHQQRWELEQQRRLQNFQNGSSFNRELVSVRCQENRHQTFGMLLKDREKKTFAKRKLTRVYFEVGGGEIKIKRKKKCFFFLMMKLHGIQFNFKMLEQLFAKQVTKSIK